MDEYDTLDIGSVWHKHWPETMYVGQWPLFHGPVILHYICKTIWRFWIIYLFLPIVVCWSLIWKCLLDIGHLFTQSARRGHPSTLDTFLVLTFIEIWRQLCKISDSQWLMCEQWKLRQTLHTSCPRAFIVGTYSVWNYRNLQRKSHNSGLVGAISWENLFCLWDMQTTKIQICQPAHPVWSAPLMFNS